MKIKSISIIVLLIFAFISCTNDSKPDIGDMLDAQNNFDFNVLLDHKSVHYKVDELYYYSDVADTTTTSYEVWLCRDEIDSTRGAYIWADNNYRPYNMILDKGDFYLTIPPKQISVMYPNYEESIIGEHDFINIFLNPKILYKQAIDTSNTLSLSSIKYKDKECTKLSISFPMDKDGKDYTITYIIDNLLNFPLKTTLVSKDDKRIYTNELYFSDVEFDNTNIDELKAKHKALIENNPLEDRGNNSEITSLERMLHIGDKAPLFEGKFYGSGKKFNINDYISNKVILIDFWYTHCPPCVEAMPYLSELYANTMSDDFIIFGLNSIDNQARSIDNLDKFLSKREISYNIILTQPEVDKKYRINGYPSIYIIDLDGNIAYVELGFDKESFEKLKSKLDDLLKK
ncbi:MAG: TlpA family protein disulfide reductase [Bacteroidales bacterium]|nr:TlpA family protein disulfide reductase [Bacteroidales bacterium]